MHNPYENPASHFAAYARSIRQAIGSAHSGSTTTVLLSSIAVRGSPLRSKIDEELFAAICESFRIHPARVPPIIVVKNLDGGYDIVDGRLRHRAATAAKKKRVKVVVLDVPAESIATFALLLNVSHGQRLNRLELRAATRAAIEQDEFLKLLVVEQLLPTRVLGKLLHVGRDLISKIAIELRQLKNDNSDTGKNDADGKSAPKKTQRKSTKIGGHQGKQEGKSDKPTGGQAEAQTNAPKKPARKEPVAAPTEAQSKTESPANHLTNDEENKLVANLLLLVSELARIWGIPESDVYARASQTKRRAA